MNKPNYYDFGYYLSKAPYMRLRTRSRGIILISNELNNIRGYSKFVESYPRIKCEPLEFLYQCHNNLCALDEHLFEDFVKFGWRGVIWASWLAAVAPNPKSYMKENLLRYQHYLQGECQWIVKEALSSLNGNSVSDDNDLGLIYDFRNYLAKLPYKKIPLRRWTYYLDGLMSRRKKLLLQVYKSQGTDAALEFYGLMKNEYDLEYKEWLIMQMDSTRRPD